jgi:hypothetical protein
VGVPGVRRGGPPADREEGGSRGEPAPPVSELALLAAGAGGLAAVRAAGLDAPAAWLGGVLAIGVPGWTLVRLLRLEEALGRSGSAVAAAALGTGAWAPALSVGFLVGLPFTAVAAIVVIQTLVVGPVALRRPARLPAAGRLEVAAGALAAAAFGYVGWRLSTGVVGDGFFHVGRMRKLDAADALSLGGISSFADDAPHAGYAFPLLHAGWAGAADLAGVDPMDAFVYLLPLCAALAMLAAYRLAWALTGWRLAGYLAAAVTAWDLCTLINGLIMQINQPPPFTFWVLVPAALLVLWAVLGGARGAAPAFVAIVGTIALVHPTYAVPVLVVGAGLTAGAWAGRTGARLRPAALALAAATVVTGVVFVWIWAVAIRGGERRSVLSHADEFVVRGSDAVLMYPWAPVFGRSYVLVAVLACALVAAHRRLAPVAGALIALLLFLLLPGLNTVALEVFGMGQFHRFWQALPWPAVLAAAACLAAARLGPWSLPLAAAIAFVSVRVQDRESFWREPTSWLVAAGIAAGVVALVLVWRGRLGARAAALTPATGLAAAVIVAAALAGPVHDTHDTLARQLRDGPYRGPLRHLTVRVTPGAVSWFRAHADQPPPVVLGEPEHLFQLIGYVDVYAQALPEARTRAEPKSDSPERRHDVQAFFAPETTPARRRALLRRWGVDYVLVDLRHQPPDVTAEILRDPALERVYADPVDVPRRLGRFVILRTASAIAARSAAGSPTGSASA